MRITVAILAAAADAAFLELNSFNKAILNANATEAATETEKWEELVDKLYAPFEKVAEKFKSFLLELEKDRKVEGHKTAINYALTCTELLSKPSDSRESSGSQVA